MKEDFKYLYKGRRYATIDGMLYAIGRDVKDDVEARGDEINDADLDAALNELADQLNDEETVVVDVDMLADELAACRERNGEA